jgi:hypothetical protein
VGKRPSFIEEATSRLSFLLDDQGFAGPESTEWPRQPFPTVTRLRYHRSDITIEIAYVVAYPGENYVEARCGRKDDEQGGWIGMGRNTTHTGYQLRRAIDLQAAAICHFLSLT